MDQLGQITLPDPIAVSLDTMPKDAAQVTTAIHDKIVRISQGTSKHVRFGKAIDAGSFLIDKELTFSGAELYHYKTNINNPSDKTIAGKIDFEGPLGRRTSALHVSRFSSTNNEIVITEARVEPLYSTNPEPMLFIVPTSSLPNNASLYPDSYTDLLTFVSEKAVTPSSRVNMIEENAEYTIFVFLLDRISPSAALQVKVSTQETGIYGYKQTTRYLNFNGWQVGILSGLFSLSDRGQTEPLYVKAVFVPGKEVGKLRPPRLIGRYMIHNIDPTQMRYTISSSN